MGLLTRLEPAQTRSHTRVTFHRVYTPSDRRGLGFLGALVSTIRGDDRRFDPVTHLLDGGDLIGLERRPASHPMERASRRQSQNQGRHPARTHLPPIQVEQVYPVVAHQVGFDGLPVLR